MIWIDMKLGLKNDPNRSPGGLLYSWNPVCGPLFFQAIWQRQHSYHLPHEQTPFNLAHNKDDLLQHARQQEDSVLKL